MRFDQPQSKHRSFDKDHLLQIGMPMGGIGAGCICLNGYGGVGDFSIRHRPATTALPDGHSPAPAAFALLHLHGDRPLTKLLEGPVPHGMVYDQGLKAQGFRQGGSEGMPRFDHAGFTAAYPFGTVELSHGSVPLGVEITGFNPFIPLDDVSSGMPCAVLEYHFINRSNQTVRFDFSYHLSHWADGRSGWKATRTARLDDCGVHFTNTEAADDTTFGSAALAIVGHRPKIKATWLRGGWFDSISALWREVSNGNFSENTGNANRDIDGRNGGSVMVELSLAPGESVTVPVVIAWHFPNAGWAIGQAGDFSGRYNGVPDGPKRVWRPFYANHWADAASVARHMRDHYRALRDRTRAFREALDACTLSPEVIDAVSSNLAILKSPTVLRQDTGTVWAWEGCFPDNGCCFGTCTHVWNYAQALPHLFPALERTLREQELERSMDERGHVAFRSAIPDGPTNHGIPPGAADGQFGGILKLYRDWRISGDTAWMKRLYPLARRSLEFSIASWDPQRIGELAEPHHNTYDIEFWGPDGMCTSVYIGALSAASLMAEANGESGDAVQYRALAERAAAFMERSLFNGEYFNQVVQWENLRDHSFANLMARPAAEDDDVTALCRREGPKYQYANGCLSDGVIGAWMARLYGVETPMPVDKIKSHLAAVYRYNFRQDLADHVCLQRPGYAMGHEPGLVLCSWPHGDQTTLPFVYSDEVWTGIEYQVASHMIAEGLVDQGLEIVKAVRSRYDGRIRNPFNEYECGSYYARAMASFSLLQALGGFRYDAVAANIYVAPKAADRPFTCFFSTDSGYGTFTLTLDKLTSTEALSIKLIEGDLRINAVYLDGVARTLQQQVTVRAGDTWTLSL